MTCSIGRPTRRAAGGAQRLPSLRGWTPAAGSPARGYPFRNQGVGIPTLRDVLRRYPDVRIIIEMKVDTPEMGEAVMREVRKAGAVDRVCLGGFGCRSAAAGARRCPEMAASACHARGRISR